jgi:hypothetical protein
MVAMPGILSVACVVAGVMYARERAYIRAALCWYAAATLAADAADAWERSRQ